jgi:probable rRNA maturation factor
MATRSQPCEGPEPESQRALVLRNHHRLRRVDLRLLRRIVHTLLRETGHDGSYDLAIYLVSAPEITLLNEKFLQHKGSTDVITFDYGEQAGPASRLAGFEVTARPSGNRRDPSRTLLHGEIFICLDEAVSQARRFQATWQSELVRYAVHGVLHLLGYDDQNARVRRTMKNAEETLVRQLAARFEFQRLSD